MPSPAGLLLLLLLLQSCEAQLNEVGDDLGLT